MFYILFYKVLKIYLFTSSAKHYLTKKGQRNKKVTLTG